MAKKVTANGKTFTFDDNVSTEQIGSSIDEYFSSLKKKDSTIDSNNTSTNGKPTSPNGGEINPTFLPSTNTLTYTDTPSALTDKGKGEYVQDQIVKKEAILNNKQNLIKNAQILGEKNKQNPIQPKDNTISNSISQALYLPALNQGFNDLIVKPLAGTTDIIDRTIDKAYTTLTGDKTPDWMRKKGAFDNIFSHYENAYKERDKPTNIVSDVAEGLVGTIPLIAAMATGQGEANVMTKAPEFFSGLTKLFAVKGGLNSFKDATDEHKSYSDSFRSLTIGAGTGAIEGLKLDAMMMLGGAGGKVVVDNLVKNGVLNGSKSAEAIIHALSVGIVFGGTNAGEDLLAGKDINVKDALKQFGMGLAFELPRVIGGASADIKDMKEVSDANSNILQSAALAKTSSDLNSESAIRNLIKLTPEHIQAINDNVTKSKDDLYTESIKNGIKAYEEKDPQAKRDAYISQLALKTQGDIKLMTEKINDNKQEVIDSINNSQELLPEEKSDLLNKVEILSQFKNKQNESTNEKVRDEQENGQGLQENEGIQSEREKNGQDANGKNVQEEVLKTEGVDNTAPLKEPTQEQQSNEKGNNEEPVLEGVQSNRVENKGEQGSSELRTEETGKEKVDALKLNDIKSKNKARANILVRELRDSEGNPLGEITIEHDGTPEDIQSSAAELNSLMESEYPNASNIQSRFLAFDENGEAKWTISPNLKKVAEINTKEGRDIAGIEESNNLKPQDNAVNQGKIEQSSIGKYKGTIEQQQGQQENRNNKEKPISPTETKTSDSNSVEQSGEKQKVDALKDVESMSTTVNNIVDKLYNPKENINDKTGARYEQNQTGEQRLKSLLGTLAEVALSKNKKEKWGILAAKGSVTNLQSSLKSLLFDISKLSKEHFTSEQIEQISTKYAESKGDYLHTTKSKSPLKEQFTQDLDKENLSTKPSEIKAEKTIEVDRKPLIEPTKLETAKERLVKAREAKKAAGLGIANDPNKNAKLLFEEHSAIVDVAKEYIKEGIDNLKDFAKELGEKVSKSITDAWNEANGGNKLKVNDFTFKTDTELIDNTIEKTIGISKAETEKQRKERGLEDINVQDTKSLTKMFEDGKTAYDSGEVKPRELALEIINKPKNLSYTEVNAFLYDRQVLRAERDELLNIKRESEDSGNLIEQNSIMKRLAYVEDSLRNNEYAVKSGARENALALATMQNMIAEDYSLSAQTARMEAKMGGKLTDEQHKELKGYMDELEAANIKLADFEKERTDKIAKDEVNKKVFESRKNKKVESKEVLKKEREVIVNDFLKELEKIRKTASSTLVPYARELLASAPFIKKMLVNLTKEGIVEFKDVVDNIHETFKEHIEGLSKEDVIDVLAGKYNDKKETKNDLIKERYNIKRMAQLTVKLEDLLKGLIKEKSEKKIVSKKQSILDLEVQIKDLEKELGPTLEERTQENLKNRLAKINEKINNNDFTKIEREKLSELTPETIALQAKVKRAQNNFDAMADRLDKAKESKFNKALDTFATLNRALLLSGVKTLGKLYSFAVQRSITTPIEEVLNTVNSKIPFLRKIAKQSPRFSGGLNFKAEAISIATRWSKVTLKDTYEMLSTGVSGLDRLYGQKGVDKDFDGNQSALEFFGRLHGAFKNSTKRAEFFRSFEKRLKYAGEQGKDINDPNVQYVEALGAYSDGKRAILMNDNILVDGYKSLLRGVEFKGTWEGKSVATFFRTILPIIKIPTNYALEALDYSTFGVRSVPYILKAAIKGSETLTPKQADMVMRSLAKGQFGLAMLIIGYSNPTMFGGYYSGKRDEKDLKAGDVKIKDLEIPHFMSHNPVLEAMQIGATFRRAMDSASGNGDNKGIMEQISTSDRDDLKELAIIKSEPKLKEPQQVEIEYKDKPYEATVINGKVTRIIKSTGFRTGLKTSLSGLSEQVPFFDTPSQISQGLKSDNKLNKFEGDFLRNRIDPRLIQELAAWQDTRDGEAIKRDPKTILENLKVGVPFLRQQVDEKRPDNYKLTQVEGYGKKFILNPEQVKQREKYITEYIKEFGVTITQSMKEQKKTNKDIEDEINKNSLKYSNNMIITENTINGVTKLKEKSKYEK
jgi:hypothetical protein